MVVKQHHQIDNIALKISSDPTLIKNFYNKIKEPQYNIPDNCEDLIKQYSTLRAVQKGLLVSKVTNPDDYQTQIKFISVVQNNLDQIHELTLDLYNVHYKWIELFNGANRYITLTYFVELNELKDGVRKAVLAAALFPVQEGVNRLQHLIERGESTYKHLMSINWNLKEGVEIIKEYLGLLKYGSTSRVMDEEV